MRSAVLLAVVLGSTSSAIADIINVPAGGSIQAAIDAAQDGDEVVVAPGTYTENLHLDAKSITVRSSDGPEVTFIQPTGQGDPLVRIENMLPGSLFNGFALTTEKIDVQQDIMRIQGGEVTVGNCVFSNSPYHGMKIETAAFATVIACTFQGLSAQGASQGSAIWIQSGMNVISGCTFLNNSANRGGSIYIDENGSSDTQIVDCTFIGNYASERGGAIFISHANQAIESSSTLIGCVFIDNSADFGGAIYIGEFADPIFINCLFQGNEALFGGGIFSSIGLKFPQLVNCSLVQNVAVVGGGIANDDFTLMTISNSIIRLNQPDQIVDDPLAATTVFYSNVEDGWQGSGNIDADPVFVNSDKGDFRLMGGSPCIDAADNTAVSEGIFTDLDGNPRFVDDLGTPNTGNTDCINPIVDMGTYEFLPFPSPPADLDGDGFVNTIDLLMLLASWGDCPVLPEQCSADLNYNCIVDTEDLLALLAGWG